MSLVDVALLILRVVVGLYVAGHGAQKLFGWFNGPGLKGAQGFLGGMLGFRPVWLWAPAVSIAEFAGGLLFALGLFSPLGAIAILASQLTATVVVHWAKGPWGNEGGYELTLTNFAVAAAVAIAGPGRYALDAVLGIALPAWFGITLALVGLVGVLLAIGSRRVAHAAQSPQAA
jgi:putative oxidoreductase